MTNPRNYEDGRPFEYSKRKYDLSNAYVSVKYEDGTIIEPFSKGYWEHPREGMVEAILKSGDHVPLYTLKIIDNQFGLRKNSFSRPFDKNGQWSLTTPKRCVVLATRGKIVFYWDSGEIKEFDSWQNDAIYNQRNMKEVEV